MLQGYAWAEDKEHCEEYGRLLQADPSKVSQRAKKRGLPQVHACKVHSAKLANTHVNAAFRCFYVMAMMAPPKQP